MRAFGNPRLDTMPRQWSYTSAHRSFEVYGYRVSGAIGGPALTLLEHVSSGGLRLRTRRWAPDGPPAACAQVTVVTAPLYSPGAVYKILDYSFEKKAADIQERHADPEGRLTVETDCSGHEFSFTGPGAGVQPLVTSPIAGDGVPRPSAGVPVHLPVRILNPRITPISSLRAELSSEYPTVEIIRGASEYKRLAPGDVADFTDTFLVRFTAGDRDFARTRLQLKLSFDGAESQENLDVLVAPDPLPPPAEVIVLDGRRGNSMYSARRATRAAERASSAP